MLASREGQRCAPRARRLVDDLALADRAAASSSNAWPADAVVEPPRKSAARGWSPDKLQTTRRGSAGCVLGLRRASASTGRTGTMARLRACNCKRLHLVDWPGLGSRPAINKCGRRSSLSNCRPQQHQRVMARFGRCSGSRDRVSCLLAPAAGRMVMLSEACCCMSSLVLQAGLECGKQPRHGRARWPQRDHGDDATGRPAPVPSRHAASAPAHLRPSRKIRKIRKKIRIWGSRQRPWGAWIGSATRPAKHRAAPCPSSDA